MKRILVVCTGNICRSPMAAGFLRKLLYERGAADVEVISAGTYALVGHPAEPLAHEVMKPLDVELTGHRARMLSPELIDWADVILVMTPEHRDSVESIVEEASGKVRLLGSYVPGNEPDHPILDPYGGGSFHYRTSVVEIIEGVKGFVEQEARELGL